MNKVAGMPMNEVMYTDDQTTKNNDEHLSNKLINQNLLYGSPGYLMDFIPKEINQVGNNVFEIVGDMPKLEHVEGHFFKIGGDKLEELFQNGEVFWNSNEYGGENAYNELKFKEGELNENINENNVFIKYGEFLVKNGDKLEKLFKQDRQYGQLAQIPSVPKFAWSNYIKNHQVDRE